MTTTEDWKLDRISMIYHSSLRSTKHAEVNRKSQKVSRLLIVGPRLRSSNLLRQTYGERFLPDQKEDVFAREFRSQEKQSATIARARISLSNIDAIIYLPVTEKFAPAKTPVS